MICSSDIEFDVVCLWTRDRSCLNPGKYFATSPHFGKKLSMAIIYLVINHLIFLVLCIIMLVLVNGCSAAPLSMRVLFCEQPWYTLNLICSTLQHLSLLYQSLYENRSIILELCWDHQSFPVLSYIPQDKGKEQ